MGNVEGVHRWDETEGQRHLPPCGQDFHWLRVGFQHLFDGDVSRVLQYATILYST